MFNQLRLKLTLINALIIFTLFLMLSIGVYCLSEYEMNRRTSRMSQKIAADIRAGMINDNLPPRGRLLPEPPPGPSPESPPGPPKPPPGQNFFFVKTTVAGVLTFQSSGQPLGAEQLQGLTKKIFQNSRAQGTIVFKKSKYYYLKSPLDNPSGILVIFHDLSPEMAALNTILTALIIVGLICSLLSLGASFIMANRAMIPIQKAWQQQKDFLSDASHELRTPLAVIQTTLDVVRGNPEETVFSQRQWLENIQEETICMTKLVDSLLFLARADSDQQPLDKKSFNISNAVNHAAAPFKAVADAKNVLLEMFIDALIEGYGDETRVKQVVTILLDNAIRHTPAGGKVTISLSQSDGKILLSISDTGEGIPSEHLDKIFDRFYQVDSCRHKGGAGLGLSIAKWIIESHGGSITVASTPGTGTAFTLKLPR